MSLRVKFYGTRGTIAVGGKQVAKYGGMTTCLRIDSQCLPSDTWLVIDAGNGIVPLTMDGLAAGVREVNLLFTHYHTDHTIGLPISAWVHMKNVPLNLWGPLLSPGVIVRDLMTPPHFPVSYEEVASHLRCKAIEHPPGMVFAIHPQGGMKLFRVDEFERAEKQPNAQLSFHGTSRYPIQECLIIRMQKTNHPDYTISYRFEERPTDKVFVFATDHENQSVTPAAIRAHLKNADLLVADCQYSENRYEQCAGYGHGTPTYCVRLAQEAGAKRLGLTHHDPRSTDTDVDDIVRVANAEAERIGFPGEVFACADYLEIEV